MIQMIAGVYGLRVKAGKDAAGNPKYRVKGMGPEDGPFSVTPEKEERLVKLGLARYVNEIHNKAANDDETFNGMSIGLDEKSLLQNNGETETVPLENRMNVKELRQLGKDYGLTFKIGTTKEEMAKAIEAEMAKQVGGVENSTDDEPVPVFNASEAVQ